MPFNGESIVLLKKQILEGEFPLPNYLTPECSRLISHILTLDGERRASMNDIIYSDWLYGITIPADEIFYRYL